MGRCREKLILYWLTKRIARQLSKTHMTGTQKSYFHRGGLQPLLGVTIPENFVDVLKRFSDREAAVSIPQNRRFTYPQIANAIDNLARELLGINFN